MRRATCLSMRMGDRQTNLVRLELKHNCVLKDLTPELWNELEPMLQIVDYRKGTVLAHQGNAVMEQYFILEGILKRVVSSADGKEMILRFAIENEIGTSYAARRLGTKMPYSICALTHVRVAQLPMEQWVDFIDGHPELKSGFELEITRIMGEVLAHTITLHLLDATGRVNRFLRKYPHLVDRLPRKELASFLNLTPETLCRLKSRGKIDLDRAALCGHDVFSGPRSV